MIGQFKLSMNSSNITIALLSVVCTAIKLQQQDVNQLQVQMPNKENNGVKSYDLASVPYLLTWSPQITTSSTSTSFLSRRLRHRPNQSPRLSHLLIFLDNCLQSLKSYRKQTLRQLQLRLLSHPRRRLRYRTK